MLETKGNLNIYFPSLDFGEVCAFSQFFSYELLYLLKSTLLFWNTRISRLLEEKIDQSIFLTLFFIVYFIYALRPLEYSFFCRNLITPGSLYITFCEIKTLYLCIFPLPLNLICICFIILHRILSCLNLNSIFYKV